MSNKTELLIAHQDPKFKQGWFYIGVVCLPTALTPCPGYYGLQVTQRTGFNIRQGQHSLKFGPHGQTSKWKIVAKVDELNTKTFTIEYWAKLNSVFCPPGDACTLGWTLFDNSGELAHKIVQFEDTGPDGITIIKFGKLVMSYGGGLQVTTDYVPPVGEWFHICTTYDSPSKELRVYVNGKFIKTFTVAIRRMAGLDIFLGGPASGDMGLDGNIDEFRLWSTLRTDAQIAKDWEIYYGESKPGLVAYWRMNEGTGLGSYSIMKGLGQKVIMINAQPFEELELFKGSLLGSVTWDPPQIYSASSTVTSAGGMIFPVVLGSTPRLWPEFPESLWDNPQTLKDNKVLWQEICIRNYTDWQTGVNLTLTSRLNANKVGAIISAKKGPDTVDAAPEKLIYQTLRNFRQDTVEGRSMKIYNGKGGFGSDPQIKSGVLWVGLSSTGSASQRQYTYLQTKTYAVGGCGGNCYHNGVCVEGKCSCYTGFTGPNCETAGRINQQKAHCPNNCTGVVLCPPVGYSKNYLTLIKNGLEDKDFTDDQHGKGKYPTNGTGLCINGTLGECYPGKCVCVRNGTAVQPLPSNHTHTAADTLRLYNADKADPAVRCPMKYDILGNPAGYRADCPADYQCQGTSMAAGAIKCIGKTADYCCTQGTPELCAGTKTVKINGVEQYFWGCSLTQYFTGAVVTLSDGSFAYLNGTVDPYYMSRPDGATFVQDSCYTYPPSQCVHGMNVTVTSPQQGKCTCFLGYEGEHCTHGPFTIPLRDGVVTVGQARCNVQQGTSCPMNAAQNEAGWHDEGKVCTAPGCEEPARSYKVSTFAPLTWGTNPVFGRPPVRTTSYYSYEYTNPCVDITITVTTRNTNTQAAADADSETAGRATFAWRMNTPNATFDQFSVLARNQPTSFTEVVIDSMDCNYLDGCASSDKALVETMTISHRDPELTIGTIDIAVFCAEGGLDCPADFIIKVDVSVPQAAPRLLDAKIPDTINDITWYEICVPDASHGLEVEVYLQLGVADAKNPLASYISTKEFVPFVLSSTLPTAIYGDAPPRDPVVLDLKQLDAVNEWGEPKREFMNDWKVNWNPMWANYDYSKKQIKGKIKFCGDSPGFKSGPLFVGLMGPSCEEPLSRGCPGRLGTTPKNIGTMPESKVTIYATTLQWKNQVCRHEVQGGDVVNGLLFNGDSAPYLISPPINTESVEVILNVYENDAELWVSETDPLPNRRGYSLNSYNVSTCQVQSGFNCTYVSPTRYRVTNEPALKLNATGTPLRSQLQVGVTCKEGRSCHAKYSMYVKVKPFVTVINETKFDNTTCYKGCYVVNPPIEMRYCPANLKQPCSSRVRVLINTSQIIDVNTQAIQLSLAFPTKGKTHLFVSRERMGGLTTSAGSPQEILTSGTVESEAWQGSLEGTKQTPAWRWLSIHKKGNPRILTLSRETMKGFESGKYFIYMIHQCPEDSTCVTGDEVLSYTYSPQIIANAVPAPSPSTLSPILLDDGKIITAKAPAMLLSKATYAYFTIPVPSPCDDVTVSIRTISGYTDAAFISPDSVTSYADATSLGWMMAFNSDTDNSSFVEANHASEYNLSPPKAICGAASGGACANGCIPTMLNASHVIQCASYQSQNSTGHNVTMSNCTSVPNPHLTYYCKDPPPVYMGSFTVQHGYSTAHTALSIGVRCIDPNGCTFNVTATTTTFPQKSLNELTQSTPNVIKWYRFCVPDEKGVEVVTRMTETTSSTANATRMGFFVSRSRIDHPKVTGYGTQSPGNWSVAGNSVVQNGFREPYWINPGFELLNSTDPSVNQLTEEKLDICPWMAGFSKGVFYVGVFVKCTNPDSWQCYSSSHAVPYTVMATAVENSCSEALVSNKTVSSVVPFGSYGRYHIELATPCTDVKVDLIETDGTHPYVFLATNATVTPTVSSATFSGRDKTQVLKSYQDPMFRGMGTTIYISVLCNSTQSCKFGIKATLTVLKQYWSTMAYVHSNFNIYTFNYPFGAEDPKQTEQLDMGLCFVQPNVRLGMETVFTERSYKDHKGIHYVRNEVQQTLGKLQELNCERDNVCKYGTQPAKLIKYVPNDFPGFWTVGEEKYANTETKCQLWQNKPFVDSSVPMILQKDTPGWKPSLYYISAGWNAVAPAQLITGNKERNGVTYGIFRVFAEEYTDQNAKAQNNTILYTILDDGGTYSSRLLHGKQTGILPGTFVASFWGEAPTPSYFKFYLDNICKRVTITLSGMKPAATQRSVFEMFVSADEKIPYWTSKGWYRKSAAAGDDITLTIDAYDPTFKVGWMYMRVQVAEEHLEGLNQEFNFNINVKTALLPNKITAEKTYSLTPWGSTHNWIASGAYQRYVICLPDAQYGLDMTFEKDMGPGATSYPATAEIWPLLEVTQRAQQSTSPVWRNTKPYYASQLFVPETRTMKLDVCSGEPHYRPGLFFVGVNATVEGMGESPEPGKLVGRGLYFNLNAAAKKNPCKNNMYDGIPRNGLLNINASLMYEFNLTDACQSLRVELMSHTGDADVYVSNDEAFPMKSSFGWSSASSGNDIIVIEPTDPGHRTGKFNILVTCDTDEACPARFSLNVTTARYGASKDFSHHSYILPGERIRYFPYCMSDTRGLGTSFTAPKKLFENVWVDPISAFSSTVTTVDVNLSPKLFVSRTRYAKTLSDIRKIPAFHSIENPTNNLQQGVKGSMHASWIDNKATSRMGPGMWFIGIYYPCDGPDPLTNCAAPPTTATFVLAGTAVLDYINPYADLQPSYVVKPGLKPITALQDKMPFKASAKSDSPSFFSFKIDNQCQDFNLLVSPVGSTAGITIYLSEEENNPHAASNMWVVRPGLNTSLDHAYRRHKGVYYIGVSSTLNAAQEFVITAMKTTVPGQNVISSSGGLGGPLRGQGEVKWFTVCIPTDEQGLTSSVVSKYLYDGMCHALPKNPQFEPSCNGYTRTQCITTYNTFCYYNPTPSSILQRDSAHLFIVPFNEFELKTDPTTFDAAWSRRQWRSPGLWESTSSSVTNDQTVLCKSSPGFNAGVYRIGVYHYCRTYTPFFAPFPRSNVASKSRCGPGIFYNVSVHPPLAHCVRRLNASPMPLAPNVTGIRYALSANGALEPGKYAHFEYDLPNPCLDMRVVLITHERTYSLNAPSSDPDLLVSNADPYPELSALTWKSVDYGNDQITLNISTTGYKSGKQSITVMCDHVKYQKGADTNSTCAGPFSVFVHTGDKAMKVDSSGLVMDQGGYVDQPTGIKWYPICRPDASSTFTAMVGPWCDSTKYCPPNDPIRPGNYPHYPKVRLIPNRNTGYILAVSPKHPGPNSQKDVFASPDVRIPVSGKFGSFINGLEQPGLAYVGVMLNSITPHDLNPSTWGYESFPFRLTVANNFKGNASFGTFPTLVNSQAQESINEGLARKSRQTIGLRAGISIGGTVGAGEVMRYSFDSGNICQDIEFEVFTINMVPPGDTNGYAQFYVAPPDLDPNTTTTRSSVYHSTMKFGPPNPAPPPPQFGVPTPPPPPLPNGTSALPISHKVKGFKNGRWQIIVRCNNSNPAITYGCPAKYTITAKLGALGPNQINRTNMTLGHGTKLMEWIDVCVNNYDNKNPKDSKSNVERGYLVSLKKLTPDLNVLYYNPQLKVQAMIAKFPDMVNDKWGRPLFTNNGGIDASTGLYVGQRYQNLQGASWVGPGMMEAAHRHDLLYKGSTDQSVSGYPHQEVNSTFILCAGTQGFEPGHYSLGIFGTCPKDPWGADRQSCPAVQYEVWAHAVEGLCRQPLIDGQTVTGAVQTNKDARYLFNIIDPCRDLVIRLTALSGEPDLFATRTEMTARGGGGSPAFQSGLNWYNYDVGSGMLVLRHTSRNFKTGMYEVVVTCDEGQICPSIFTLQAYTTKLPDYAKENYAFSMQDNFASSFQQMRWYPFCLTAIPSASEFNVTLSSTRGGTILVTRNLGSTEATRIEDVYGWHSAWASGTDPGHALSLILRPNQNGYLPGPFWVGVFTGLPPNLGDTYSIDTLTFKQSPGIAPAPPRGFGDPITLFVDDPATFQITKGERHPYRFAVSDVCRDIVFDLSYSTAAVGEPDVIASFIDTDPDIPTVYTLPTDTLGWSTMHACDLATVPIEGCVAKNVTTATARTLNYSNGSNYTAYTYSTKTVTPLSTVFVKPGLKRLTIKHDDENFQAGVLRVAVACTKLAECAQTYSIKVSLKTADTNIKEEASVTAGGIRWHSVCMSNISFGLNITTEVPSGSPTALVYVTQSKSLATTQADVLHVPTFRSPEYWSGSNGKTTLSTLICENMPGTKPGKYYIGVFTKCVAYDPIISTSPFPGLQNKQSCAAGVTYTLHAHASQHLCLVDLPHDRQMGGVLTSRPCKFSWCSDGRALYRYTPKRECVDLLFKVTAVNGDPDIHITTIDFDPSDLGYSWRSRNVGNDQVLVQGVDSKFRGQEFRFSIACEKKYENHTALFYDEPRVSAACPSTFMVEVMEVPIPDSIDVTSYLDFAGLGTWRPVCFNSSVRAYSMSVDVIGLGKASYTDTIAAAGGNPAVQGYSNYVQGMIAGMAVPDALKGTGPLCSDFNGNCLDFETTNMRRVPLGTRDYSKLPFKDGNLLPLATGSPMMSEASSGSFMMPFGAYMNCTQRGNCFETDSIGKYGYNAAAQVVRGTHSAGIYLGALKDMGAAAQYKQYMAWEKVRLDLPAPYRLRVSSYYTTPPKVSPELTDTFRTYLHGSEDEARRQPIPCCDIWVTADFQTYMWADPVTDLYKHLETGIRMCMYHYLDIDDLCSDVNIVAEALSRTDNERSPHLHMMMSASYDDKFPSTDGTSWLGRYPVTDDATYYLKLRAGDPKFRLGRLYVSMCCVKTPCTMYYKIKMTKTALKLQQENDVQIAKQKIKWYPICIQDPLAGLNITTKLINSFDDPEPHFVVTKEWHPAQVEEDAVTTMTFASWMSPGFWYQWRGLWPATDTQDQKVLCGSSPGFAKGTYYVGVLTKCHVTVPYFSPAPYPDLTHKGATCDGLTKFKLQMSTSNTACVIPILNNVPLSGTVGVYGEQFSWYRFNVSDLCQDIAFRLVTVSGDADVAVSNAEGAPLNMLGYTWHEKGETNELLKISRGDINFKVGMYTLAVSCHGASSCPARFSLQVVTSYPSASNFVDSSYTSDAGKIRWYESCARTYLEAISVWAGPRQGTDGNLVVSKFKGPKYYNSLWKGRAWREDFSDEKANSELPYEYIVAHNMSGFTPGVYYFGVDFHKVAGRDAANEAHAVVNSFYVRSGVSPAEKYKPPEVDPGQFLGIYNPVVYGVYLESPCPANSREDPLMHSYVTNPDRVWGGSFGQRKPCRCDDGYYGLQPGDVGPTTGTMYNPEVPHCERRPDVKFYRCEMWKNCYAPYFCGLFSENMCQPLKELRANTTSSVVTFVPDVSYFYDYYQYKLRSICSDVWFTVNSTQGIASITVATTGDELSVTSKTLGWASNTYDDKQMTVKISNEDEGFPIDTKVLYVAISCYRECPAGIEYAIQVQEFPKAQSRQESITIKADQVAWTAICAATSTDGLYINAKGPAAASGGPCPGPDCPDQRGIVSICVDDPAGIIVAAGESAATRCGLVNTTGLCGQNAIVLGATADNLCPYTCGLCSTYDCDDENMIGQGGSGYRGCQSKTLSGLTCQKWGVQTPNQHVYTPENFPNSNLRGHNFCRNPSVLEGDEMPWCYVEGTGTSTTKRWEYCQPIGIDLQTPLIYLTYKAPGPARYNDSFMMPSWKSNDVFYNLNRQGTDLASVSLPGSSEMRIGRGVPGFGKGCYYVGVYVDCKANCTNGEWKVELTITTAVQDLYTLYKGGLFIEYVQQCAMNPNDVSVGNHKCLISREKHTAALKVFGITRAEAVSQMLTALDTNGDSMLSWYEIEHSRLQILKRLGNYNLQVPSVSMLHRPPPATWRSGVVEEDEYMYFEQYLGRCDRMCVTVTGTVGTTELLVSPPPNQRPTKESAVWFSRNVQRNQICVDPETTGFEPGVFRVAVTCTKGYICPGRFFINFNISSIATDVVKTAGNVSNVNGITWFKTCNAQKALIYTKYPTSRANSASKGDDICDFPQYYRGKAYTQCITEGMPYPWCYHKDGTWGECNLGYLKEPALEKRPDTVAVLTTSPHATKSGLGSLRLIAIKGGGKLPKSRSELSAAMAAMRPTSYGTLQSIRAPVEATSNGGIVYWGVYAACGGTACGSTLQETPFTLNITKVVNSAVTPVIAARDYNTRRAVAPAAPTLITLRTPVTIKSAAVVPSPSYFKFEFNPICQDIVVQIESPSGARAPHLFLSPNHINVQPEQDTISSYSPEGSYYVPSYIPAAQQMAAVENKAQIWISHQSRDFASGYWYIGVHCTNEVPNTMSTCSHSFTLTVLAGQAGVYPFELLLNSPFPTKGVTRRGAPPVAYSICMESDEMGVRLKTLWQPSLNKTLDEANRKAHIGIDPYKSPPDPITTPLFVLSRSDNFEGISSSSQAPVFLSSQNQIGSQAAMATNDNMTVCSQLGWGKGVWYIGVFGYCLGYQRHTSFLPYEGFGKSVACLPWYQEGEFNPGTSFNLDVSINEPKCPGNCVSDVTYTKNTGPEQHGRCYGCRGTCICDKYWGGESCGDGACQYDNCFGHGVCTSDGIHVQPGKARSDCICDPGYSGIHCADKEEAICPADCYGQGDCNYRWINIPSNITVGSCECKMDYTGHLCSFVPDRKKEDERVPGSILGATVLVCLALLFAIKIMRINRTADIRDEYDAMRHQTQAFTKPAKKTKKKLDDDSSSEEDGGGGDESDEESDEEDWPDDRDWRPKKRKEVREDGLVKDGDNGTREES